jgi:RNA 2',3'-cyclic 3'-phosphodiesterase
MRLFFAVTVPENLIHKLLETQRALRDLVGEDGVRYARPEQFHYTLKFLGEVDVTRAEKAVAAAGAIRERHRPFTLTLGRLGAFPSDQRPSTIWVGASDGGAELSAVAEDLDLLLAKSGFKRENKPLKAHLTLGRVKSYRGEEAAARAIRRMAEDPNWSSLGSFSVDRFVLMRSVLRPGGSEYTPVDQYDFVS